MNPRDNAKLYPVGYAKYRPSRAHNVLAEDGRHVPREVYKLQHASETLVESEPRPRQPQLGATGKTKQIDLGQAKVFFLFVTFLY